MRLKTLAALLALAASFHTSARADLSIMPLGDSITYGAHLMNGGYRYTLFIDLSAAGIGFHYVGQSSENSAALPFPAQWHHNGFPGATIQDIVSNLDGNVQTPGMYPNQGGYWMTNGKQGGDPINPDLVLLMAGTNNIIHPPAQGGTDVEAMKTQFTDLIAWFTKNRPNTTILIGTVIPITRQPATQNEQVVAFNIWLKANVSTFGSKCSLVDLYSKFLKPDGTPDSSLLGDGVHPSQPGYDIMGKAWADAIGALVAGGTFKKELPAPLGRSFAPSTGNQMTVPRINNTRISPAAAKPGMDMSLSATLVGGNNALTAPVITYTLKDAKGKAIEGIADPASLTLPNLPPHGEAPISFSFKLPDKVEPGVYDVGITETSAEGSVNIRYGGKVTVSP